MAKAKKLPSGNWRVLVYDKTIDGKRKYKSFTDPDRRIALLMAAEFAASKDASTDREDITLSEAVHRYIDVKTPALSPNTVRGYKNVLPYIDKSYTGKKRLTKLTNEDLQLWVSALIQAGLSTKSIHNMTGVVISTLGMFAPDFRPRITLPPVDPQKRYVPSDDDIKALIQFVAEDPELLAAVYLYAFGPMRRGEICALEDTDICGNKISVTKALVKDLDKKWIVRRPKTSSSIREIAFPDFVIQALPQRKGRIFTANPDSLSDKFKRVQKKTGISYSMHDLRHYAASIMHAIGVPNKYIQERGGWRTDTVMKSVYQDVIDAESVKQEKKIFDHFEGMQHEMQHEMQKAP